MENEYESRVRQKKRRYLLPALMGAIFGAILISIMLFFFLRGEALKADSLEQADNSEMIKTASEGVLGVINLQMVNPINGETTQAGVGSGVAYKEENGFVYIVTNQHVIEGATNVEVSLNDGSRIEAEVVGGDIWTDLAVIRSRTDKINTIISFGNSDNLLPGNRVVAIGNPLGLRFSDSATEGIISGIERSVPIDINADGAFDWDTNVLQTDAAINPGNSGGALLNEDGELIGINSMKISIDTVEGIGFAIPINVAIPIIESLEKDGEVKRAYMGISNLRSLSELSENEKREGLNLPNDINEGVIVYSVIAASPSSESGIISMDVIVELDGKKVSNTAELRQYIYNEKNIGDELSVTFYRNGERMQTNVTLTEDPY